MCLVLCDFLLEAGSARFLIFQSVIKPRRSPRLTASVRLDAPSLLEIDEIWNFTVWSLICSLRAMSLFDRPWLTSSSTSRSRVVKDSSGSVRLLASTKGGPSYSHEDCEVGRTISPCAVALTAAWSCSAVASNGTMPQLRSSKLRSTCRGEECPGILERPTSLLFANTTSAPVL